MRKSGLISGSMHYLIQMSCCLLPGDPSVEGSKGTGLAPDESLQMGTCLPTI